MLKEKTFTVTMTSQPGSIDNPYDLKEGDNQVKISAGNDQGCHPGGHGVGTGNRILGVGGSRYKDLSRDSGKILKKIRKNSSIKK